jgi:predicted Zn finger-like uncharacterized protein
MLIVCPSCASEYAIDPEKLGPTGRQVRCALCRDTWFAAPDGAPPGEAPAGATLLGAPEPPPRRRRAGRWLAAAALLAAASAAAQVPAAWIERGRGVASQLLAPARPALAFRNVMSEIDGPSGARMLVVTGEIVNAGPAPASLAPLEFLVRSGDERVLAAWTSAPPRPTLPPGEAARFEVRFAGPPEGGRDVRVHFSPRTGVALAWRQPS